MNSFYHQVEGINMPGACCNVGRAVSKKDGLYQKSTGVSQLERAPSDQRWNNLSIKINNNNTEL